MFLYVSRSLTLPVVVRVSTTPALTSWMSGYNTANIEGTNNKQTQNLTARNKMKSQTENRRTLTIIVTTDKKWFHFTKLLQMAGTSECTPDEDRVGGPIYNLWFPVGADLFTTVEAVLQRHDIAHN